MNTPKSTALATAPSTALVSMAQRLSIEPDKLAQVLKSTVFSACRNDEEMAALVVVANEYGLNPLLKEIYAFPAKGGGIVPMVPIDGWVRLINSHPQMDGMTFEVHNDAKGELEAMTCRIFRKDRSQPIEVTEYLSECVRATEPWKMKHRMLRHKALMQCGRYAFGFGGIHDEDEAAEVEMRNVTPPKGAQRNEVKSPFATLPNPEPEQQDEAVEELLFAKPAAEAVAEKPKGDMTSPGLIVSVTNVGDTYVCVVRGEKNEVAMVCASEAVGKKAQSLEGLGAKVTFRKEGTKFTLTNIELLEEEELV
jgi:hypothetical protein